MVMVELVCDVVPDTTQRWIHEREARKNMLQAAVSKKTPLQGHQCQHWQVVLPNCYVEHILSILIITNADKIVLANYKNNAL